MSIRSALEQRDVSFELFVVGDGVGDVTRQVMGRFEDDARMRFFDLPKGERRGERNRHEALQEARGEIVCYLSDDDILLPWHVAEMRRLLVDVDFAHGATVRIDPDGLLDYRPGDLARSEFSSPLREGLHNFVSLTGASHTRSLYDRLPYGWRAAPPGKATDAHMWQQVLSLPDVRAATSPLITSIHFPDPTWREVPDDVRAAAVEGWLERALRPEGEVELQALLEVAIRHAALDSKLRTIELRSELESARHELELLRAPVWKRLGRKMLSYEAARTLRERLR